MEGDSTNIWQIQDAKARFSALVDSSLENGPQIVTRRGVEAVVVIPYDQWMEHEQTRRRNIKELLLAPEARTESLVPPRLAATLREPPVF